MIGNAISANMLPEMNIGDEVVIRVKRITEPSADEKKNMKSVVGHPDTASIIGVPCNRETVTLDKETVLTVAQYIGPRLDPGTTVLPEGAQIKYFQFTLEDPATAE